MKNTENLIGKKVKGFYFESTEKVIFWGLMGNFIDKVGYVKKTYSDGTCMIDFGDDYFFYPTDQVLNHLLEVEEPVKEEILTLNDGFLMLVSNDGKKWYKRYVLGKRGHIIYAYVEKNSNLLNEWKYSKPLPTKEEQLTAILGSSEKVAEIMELFKSE